jgi:hypothetical protein
MTANAQAGGNSALNEAMGWIGSPVDDVYGIEVGRLEDVWIDPGTGLPRWLVVDRGLPGGHNTLIPFDYVAEDASRVWTPYEAEVVARAPAVDANAPLTRQVEAALQSHYDAIIRIRRDAVPPARRAFGGAGVAAPVGGPAPPDPGSPPQDPPTESGQEVATPYDGLPPDPPPRKQAGEPGDPVRGLSAAERAVALVAIESDEGTCWVDIKIEGPVRLRGEVTRLEILPVPPADG